MKKKTKHLNYAYERFFMIFLKAHFPHFPMFSKLISCTYLLRHKAGQEGRGEILLENSFKR